MRREIESLPFRRPDGRSLGFEVFTLRSLYERAERVGFDLEGPQRPEFDMILLGTEGRGKIVVDFLPVPLGKRWLTFVAHGRVRQFVIDRGADAWMLLFEPERVGPSSVLAPTWAEPALEIPAAARATFDTLVAELVAEQERGGDDRQAAILDHLLRVVVLQAERLKMGTSAALPDALERFFAVLERDCARTRSVAHYARAAGVSTRRLGELLGERVGKSTKQVIDERVVLECKRLLAHTDVSVKELADQLAFDEPTNLVKFFRRHTRTTPIAFRAAQRAKP
jgi:AraC-like DNA-binding protein